LLPSGKIKDRSIVSKIFSLPLSNIIQNQNLPEDIFSQNEIKVSHLLERTPAERQELLH
jgi:hypothetical protein